MKVNLPPYTMIYPLPAALVSCGLAGLDQNIITIAWTGTICSEPPMCYISIRPSRHSHAIVKKHGAFVINLSNELLAKASDWCGLRSGADYNKFHEMGLTALTSERVASVMIAESPVCIECEVTEIRTLGSHDMFMARVAGIVCDSDILNAAGDYPDPAKTGLISYSFRHYFEQGKVVGKQGFSIK
jgi:flavin reductase (DIM6/NTAB) family NADH-FMN oxidoreductase RutF